MGHFHESPDDDDRDLTFADPGGRSALRAASRSNPRNLACPTCKRRNVLTPADRAQGYQCDACADRAEGGGYGRGDY
jgi:ribosomal protein L37AE/L43A